MNVVSLMYHDVTSQGREDTSGFPGADAARYKLTPVQLAEHLAAIRRCVPAGPVTIDKAFSPRLASDRALLLTFDDGGVSADEAIADALERFGWLGHVFVTAGYIDRPGFLSRAQIRDLRRRGHVIGSHSWTHPLRMAHCTGSRLREEWARSVDALGNIVGEAIACASVPGGHYSDEVAETAAAAGIRFLFTSRPTVRVRQQGNLLVLGRYAVQRSTSARRAAAVAAGALAPRLQQFAWWELKAIAKAVAGARYLKVRGRLLGRSDQVQWGDELARLSKDPS